MKISPESFCRHYFHTLIGEGFLLKSEKFKCSIWFEPFSSEANPTVRYKTKTIYHESSTVREGYFCSMRNGDAANPDLETYCEMYCKVINADDCEIFPYMD